MKPNIDRKGRIARAITGLACISFGLAIWPMNWPASIGWRCGLSTLAVAAGVFQLFEARRGWCVARACGLKTPM